MGAFFVNMGLPWPLYEVLIFYFSQYIVRSQLTIFKMVNDDRKQEKRWKSMTHFIKHQFDEAQLTARILHQKAQGCPAIQTGLLQLKSIALPPRPKAAGAFTDACPTENVTRENVAKLFW